MSEEIIGEGYITDVEMNIDHEDVHSWGRVYPEQIVTGRQVKVNLRLVNWSEHIFDHLGFKDGILQNRVKLFLDIDDEPHVSKKRYEKKFDPKRRILIDKTW